MSQIVVPPLYQISPAPDVLINGLFEGLTEPRPTGPSCLFLGRSLEHTAASGRDVNTGPARAAKTQLWTLQWIQSKDRGSSICIPFFCLFCMSSLHVLSSLHVCRLASFCSLKLTSTQL